MHIGSRVLAAGADYRLMGPRATELHSTKPVVAICAVRTGSGKSQTTRHVAGVLRNAGKRVAVLRHPMPYGDLVRQAVQRFEKYEDLDAADCTIEEREEYEPHLAEGNLVFAGIDYGAILERAAGGGGRDPLGRRQQRHAVHPSRRAHRGRRPAPRGARAPLPPGRDQPAHGRRLRHQQARLRARRGRRGGARVDRRAEPARADRARQLAVLGRGRRGARSRGKRVLAVEDGPTLTHGDMAYGAAVLAARQIRRRRARRSRARSRSARSRTRTRSTRT